MPIEKKDKKSKADLYSIIQSLEDRLKMETEMRENLEYAINEITEHLFSSLEELSGQSEKLKKQNLELEIQDKIVKIINQEISLERVLKTLLHQALYLFPHGEKGAFLQYDPMSERFGFSVVEGYDPTRAKKISITYKKWAKTISKDAQKLDDGILIVKGFDADHSFRTVFGEQSNSILAVALSVDRKLDDFLILDNTKEPELYDQSDIQTLLRFREHAVSAISKAKILDLLQAEKEKTEKALKNTRHTNKKLEAARKELEVMSFTDPLTKLNNRRFLNTFIKKELAQTNRSYHPKNLNDPGAVKKTSIGFTMLDIDHFKYVNDTFGHDSGDLVLKQVAYLLKKNCRESDIIIRWGGEEFLIVSLGIEKKEASLLPARIKTAIENHVFVIANHKPIHRTCSIGFACYPFISSDIKAVDYEQTITIADKCLYMAKQSGRNAWVGLLETKKTGKKDIRNILDSKFIPQVTDDTLNVLTSNE